MIRRGPASGVAVLLSVICALILGAAPAAACNDPAGHLLDDEAGPGEQVPYQLSDTEPGAGFTITVNGRSVHAGTDTTGTQGFEGVFTMPELGPSQTAYVRFVIEHTDGGPWASEPAMSYRAPAPPPAQQPQAPEAPAPSDPAASGDPAAPGEPAGQPPANQPGAGAAGTGPTAGPSPADGPGIGPGPDGSPGARGAAAGSALPEQAATNASGETTAGESAGVDSSRRAAASVPAARAAQAKAVPAPRQADVTFAEPAVAPNRGAEWEIPAVLLIGLALSVVAGAAAVLLSRRRGGGGPDSAPAAVPPWTPPPVRAEAGLRALLIEAELQEMIAEARAAELLAPAPDERSPERPRPLRAGSA